MKLEALYNAVIVKPVESEETTYGSIIVPDMGSELNKSAEVISVGPGYYSNGGNFIETTLVKGDIVVLPTMGFTRFESNGTEYWVGKENEVLARLGSSITISEILEQTEVTKEEKQILENHE
jgi:co-chaperonin GroES (HSP10)